MASFPWKLISVIVLKQLQIIMSVYGLVLDLLLLTKTLSTITTTLRKSETFISVFNSSNSEIISVSLLVVAAGVHELISALTTTTTNRRRSP